MSLGQLFRRLVGGGGQRDNKEESKLKDELQTRMIAGHVLRYSLNEDKEASQALQRLWLVRVEEIPLAKLRYLATNPAALKEFLSKPSPDGMIRFSCESCYSDIVAPETARGTVVSCTHCGTSEIVPDPTCSAHWVF